MGFDGLYYSHSIQLDDSTVPRSFEDYQVNVNETGLPSGVTLERKA